MSLKNRKVAAGQHARSIAVPFPDNRFIKRGWQPLIFLLLQIILLLLVQTSHAQNYTYATESFESTAWPTADPGSTPVTVVSTTGAWKLGKGVRITSPVHTGTYALSETSTSFQLVTPTLPNGVGSVSFWAYENGTSNRTVVVKSSTDNGATFPTTAYTSSNVSQNSWTQYSFPLVSQTVNALQFTITGGSGIVFDDILITPGAQTPPTVTTTTATSISFSAAFSGGNVNNTGNATVTARGVVWSTTPAPTTITNTGMTTDGSGTGSFTSNLNGLVPSTTYYYRAYATNSLGTAYGTELSFTTAPPAPTLSITPTSLNFGNQQANTTSSQQTYTLSGIYLSPAIGNITITAPAGYKVSTTSGGGYASSITIPYTGSTLNATTIYVRFSPTSVGIQNGIIINSGGGAPGVNVNVAGVGSVPTPDFTNVGFDFWTGFGYEEKMNQKAGNSNEAKLSLYISVPSGTLPAQVVVDLPGIPGAVGFPKTVTVTPGTVTEVQGFPTGDPNNANNPTGMPDTRLYYTGASNRGIHIYSSNGVPVSAWMYSYTTGNSAAGAMLFPTNTWSSSYTVQAYGGYSNNSNPNSFFFIIAKEDNTPIWFKPSQDVLDSITGSSGTIFTDGHTAAQVKYQKNIEYGPIILNKGQIFNAMGFIQGSGSGVGAGKAFGLDLTGSTVRTTCDKQIAVFGGNGRALINPASCSATSGSDHMIQQMFPSIAWGKKYLTTPTTTMEYNLYRINVTDPTTQVWVNNPTHTTPLTGLINNLYYEIATSQAQSIESDKPITVTQFIVAQGCANANGSKGLGDPEMIILSPVEQAINSTTVYSATIKNPAATYNGHYINVIIKKNGVASFRLDGGTTGDPGIDQTTATPTTVYDTGGTLPLTAIFKPHPQDTTYYYASLRVQPGMSHTLTSDSTFNAIAYGMGDGESYGYNAGTKVKDLSQVLLVQNQYGQTKGLTCKNNPFYYKIALPYAPAQLTSLTWDFDTNPNMTPNATVVQNNPTQDSTYSVDGVSYYVYKLPSAYQFSVAGNYPFKVSANALTTGGCTGTKLYNNSITVSEGPTAKFAPAIGTCGNLTVQFTDQSTSDSTNLIKWRWDFGNLSTLADTSLLQNPGYTYPSAGLYTVSLRAVNEAGCYRDTTRQIDLSGAATALFTITPTTSICAGSSITFSSTAASSGTYGSITTWKWNFGDGSPVVNATTGANISHTYTTAGSYTASLIIVTSNGCTVTSTQTIITVNAVPSITSAATGSTCSGTAQNYVITSAVTGTTFTWSRAAVTGISNAAANGTGNITETLTNTTNAPITVTYVITPATATCTGSTFNYVVTVNPKPTADFTFTNSGCAKDPVNFTSVTTGTITGYSWNFGDGSSLSTSQNPVKTYSSSGIFNVTLTATATGGCTASATKPVTVAATLAVPVVTTDSSINSVKFSWPSIAGATGYEVSLDGGVTFIPANGTGGLSHTVSGLQPNQSVTIIVRANGALVCQANTATATARTFLPDVGVFVPNTFSPNDDGKNDVLKVYGNYIQALDMKIFNQWGQLIFTSKDAGRGWDGTASGKAQPVGVYAYVITVTLRSGEVVNKKGLVNLVR